MAGHQTCHRKLVLLGETSVGKTCVTIRFVKDEFFEFQEPTIGAAFLTQTITIDNTTVKFEIWDTAGQERYRSLAPMYYRGATSAIIVYDITSPSSFEGAKSWVKELQRRGDPHCVIALAANKADLDNEEEPQKSKRKVSKEVFLHSDLGVNSVRSVEIHWYQTKCAFSLHPASAASYSIWPCRRAMRTHKSKASFTCRHQPRQE